MGTYIRRMSSKPIELPHVVARAFVRDMKAFFACGHDTIKADGIAAMQLHALKQHYAGKLRLTDIKEMFTHMQDQV
jgi:hypothetical protein